MYIHRRRRGEERKGERDIQSRCVNGLFLTVFSSGKHRMVFRLGVGSAGPVLQDVQVLWEILCKSIGKCAGTILARVSGLGALYIR